MPDSKLQEVSLTDLLADEFDLKPRYNVGEDRYYRLLITYNNLDSQGMTASRAQFIGDFRRHVDSVDATAKAYETITWRNIFFRGGGPTGPYSEPVPLPWAEGYSYRFSAEDGYAEFPWEYQGIPRDALGWNFVLLTIDAHFEFDFLRSTRHGAIEKLRRIGDEVITPDSDQTFDVLFPPMVTDCRFHRRGYRTRFAGLTLICNKPCAVIEFAMATSPFRMTTEGLTLSEGAPAASEPIRAQVELSSTFAGTINITLEDASIDSGAFIEYVFSCPAEGDGSNRSAGAIRPEYKLGRITKQSFETGGNHFEL